MKAEHRENHQMHHQIEPKPQELEEVHQEIEAKHQAH
jgi:hypothetical protein